MKFAMPESLSRFAGNYSLKLQQHAPTILFGTGVVGVVGTVVLASRATLKLDETLRDHKASLGAIDHRHALGGADYGDKERAHDKTVVYVRIARDLTRLYMPAVALGVISIGSLTGAHNILSKRNASLTAAYAGLEKSFREYRKRVSGEVGEDRENELYYDIQEFEETDDKGKTVKVKRVGKNQVSPYARFFDKSSTKWNHAWEYNPVFLKCQQNYMNDLLRIRGHVFLNEVYDALGLERSEAGSQVGWIYGGSGDDFIDFGIFKGDEYEAIRFIQGDEPAVLLDFNVDGVISNRLEKF